MAWAMVWDPHIRAAMGVLCIAAGALASMCGPGQARTREIPQARESAPDSGRGSTASALLDRMLPRMEPPGARGTETVLRLAASRLGQHVDPSAQRPPPQRPPELERGHQAPEVPQAQGGATPAAQQSPASASAAV